MVIRSSSGQIALFAFLGLVIVVIIGILFYPSNISVLTDDSFVDSTESVDNYIQSCVNIAAEQALITLSVQGFQKEYLPDAIDLSNSNNPKLNNLGYVNYLYNHTSYMPNLDVLQYNYEFIVSKYITECIDLNMLKTRFHNVISSDYYVDATMFDNKIVVSVDYNITLQLKNNIRTLRKSGYTIDYPYIDKYELIKKFITIQESNPEFFQLGYLAYFSDRNNINYNAFYIGENTSVVVINCSDYKTNPMIVFAVRTS